MGESADSNERVRPTGGAGQDSRAGGLYASTRLTGPQRPSGRRHASPVEWPAAAPTSNDFCPDAILARDTVPPDLRALIRSMSEANPRWGAPRIKGELLKLGIDVSQATVAKYIVRHRQPPSQTW